MIGVHRDRSQTKRQIPVTELMPPPSFSAPAADATRPPVPATGVRSKLPDVGTTIFTVMSQLAMEHGAINLSQGLSLIHI